MRQRGGADEREPVGLERDADRTTEQTGADMRTDLDPDDRAEVMCATIRDLAGPVALQLVGIDQQQIHRVTLPRQGGDAANT